MTLSVVVVAVLGFSSASSAGQQGATPPPPQVFPAPQDRERAAEEFAQAALREFAAAQKPTVNCGLTLVSPDPKHDAKFRVPPPKGPTPTIRTIPPPACRADQGRTIVPPAFPRRSQ